MDLFHDCFGDLPDPRADNARHELSEILFIALLASLCGAKGCSAMAEFGRSKEALLRTILTLEHGIPSHDTFSALFRMLDPKAFEAAFREFTRAFGAAANIGKTKGVVAVDGKSLRRAYEVGQSHMPRLMVTVWGAQTRMALANVLAENNNEAEAALQLIQLVALKGCVVTADALHCHREMARVIVERGGDYVLAVKDNQPSLLRDAQAALSAIPKHVEPVTTKDTRHGRKETRSAIVTSAKGMAEKHNFPGLQAVARVTSKRGKDKPVERYFLLSRRYSSDALLRIVRTPLDHREQPALAPRCRARRRPRAKPQGLRTPKPRRHQTNGAQHRQSTSRQKNFPDPETHACRLGRGLPLRTHPPYAIALPPGGACCFR